MHPNTEQFNNVVDFNAYKNSKDPMTAPGPNHPASKAIKSKKQVEYEKKNPENKDLSEHYADVEKLFED
jgi:hypothetical protein